jgi:hypothetical protein
MKSIINLTVRHLVLMPCFAPIAKKAKRFENVLKNNFIIYFKKVIHSIEIKVDLIAINIILLFRRSFKDVWHLWHL